MHKQLKTAIIKLWGQEIGAVTWLDDAYAVFEYTDEFQRSGLNIAPITMPTIAMPVTTSAALPATAVITTPHPHRDARFMFPELNKETFHGLPGLLADSLPDKFGNAIISEWLAKTGRAHESLNPVERLCFIGSRGMGALEFTPASNPNLDTGVSLEIDSLVEQMQNVMQAREQMQLSLSDEEDKANEAALLDILRVTTSAGGARAKALIGFNEKDGSLVSGQAEVPEEYNLWLLKFDGVEDIEPGQTQHQGRIEYAYALMARAAKININECRLLEENERAHFMTRRFDRITDSHTSSKSKLHMQTLCALAHYDYNRADAHSYEQVFSVMRELRLAKSAALEQYKRMLFNVFARNQEDHSKNIAFLMDKTGKWQLSPAFDLTYTLNPKGVWSNQHQMSINGKRDNFTRQDLISIAESISLPKPERVIEQVKQAVSQWPTFAKRAGVKKNIIKNIALMHRLDI